ncbi:MAG: hypothetical protein AB7L90_02775 [Hyphomicrobiaceae bacterium]
MSRLSSPVSISVLVAAGLLVLPGAAAAQGKSRGACVHKAASGTNTTKDGAMFQAWEAVLQATDWGSWASFMTTSGKIGVAPGYKVSRVKSRCGAGGLGYNCKMQATLCK